MSHFNPYNPVYTSVQDDEYWNEVFAYFDELIAEEKFGEQLKQQTNEN